MMGVQLSAGEIFQPLRGPEFMSSDHDREQSPGVDEGY